jgi:hypothetical protein
MTRKEKLIQLLMKLKVMSERGTPNERISAQNKLDYICKKHRLNINEIFPPKPLKKRTFRLHSFTDEKDILVHCILDSSPESEITGNESTHQIHVKLSDKDYKEVLDKYQHYWKLYLKEREALLAAFIIKNNLGIVANSSTEEEIYEDVESVINYLQVVKEHEYNSNQKLSLN